MNMYKCVNLLLLIVVLGACQQEEITPKPADPDTLVVEGRGGPVTLSGEVSLRESYQSGETTENGLRDLNYGTYLSSPQPTLEGTTTKLTCVFKNFSDASQPVSTLDIEWTNSGATTVQLKHKDITLSPGTDLTKSGWYMMAFTYTNGGASGQTFSFDKDNYKIIVTAPSSNQGSAYYDVMATTTDGRAPQPYKNVPALFASNWVPLTAVKDGNNVGAELGKTLELKPQGQLIVAEDEYRTSGQNVIDALGNLDTRHYLHHPRTASQSLLGNLQGILNYYKQSEPGNPYYAALDANGDGTITYGELDAVALGRRFRYTDPTGFTWRDLLGAANGVPHETASLTEATDLVVWVPPHVVFSGAYHIWMDSPEGPGYLTNVQFHESKMPEAPASSLVFVGPNETYADGLSRIRGPLALGSQYWSGTWRTQFGESIEKYQGLSSFSPIPSGWSRYTFKNPSPKKYLIADNKRITYARYLWVNNVKYIFAYTSSNKYLTDGLLRVVAEGVKNTFSPRSYTFDHLPYSNRVRVGENSYIRISSVSAAGVGGSESTVGVGSGSSYNHNGAIHWRTIYNWIDVSAKSANYLTESVRKVN